jgi:UDP-N-acetylmuramoyl-tripeptide--D-alanyl-D-alanine ligase
MLSCSNVIWTAKDAVAATGGHTTSDWSATGVSIDTRTIEKGNLFIAIKGDYSDGHDYVAEALEKGASAAVVSHVPEGVSENAPLLIVTDTFEAMQDLGCASRKRTGAKVIGITGSVGKTGTKEMLAVAFDAFGQTHYSKVSYNNHWGVPLSLSNMHGGADFGIFEMGMNHPGEITPLARQVRPDIAIITTIAPVHMEHFDSVEDIAAAKAEIFDGMNAGSTAILNRDNEWFGYLKEKAEKKGINVCSFGEGNDADVRMRDCLEAANGSRIKATIMDEDVAYTLPVPGRHIACNSLAVLAAVKVAGGDVRKAAKALEKVKILAGRGLKEFLDIGNSHNPVTLIDESYNASPIAMQAAFKVLALIDPGRGGRRIAVLGDMLELGNSGPEAHRDLAMPLCAADVNLVYTCGKLMKNLYEHLPEERRGAHKEDSSALAKIVPDVLVPGDVVMVKGSLGSKMGVVVEALRALPGKLCNKSGDTELSP